MELNSMGNKYQVYVICPRCGAEEEVRGLPLRVPPIRCIYCSGRGDEAVEMKVVENRKQEP